MSGLEKWSWAVTLVVVIANWLWLKSRAESLGLERPDLDPGFHAIARAFLFYFGGACVLVGLGRLTGIGNLGILRPQVLSPYDFACMALAVLVVIRGAAWVYARGGAEFLARHAMIFRRFPSSPFGVKVAWGLGTACVLAGIGFTVIGVAGR
jgi:hypothetical protein